MASFRVGVRVWEIIVAVRKHISLGLCGPLIITYSEVLNTFFLETGTQGPRKPLVKVQG